MESLNNEIDLIIKNNNLKIDVIKNQNIFPFNFIEIKLSLLLSKGILKFEDYITLRENYIERNKFLPLYNLSSKKFGVTWAQTHILELSKDIIKPSKKLDENFDKNYDLYYIPNKKKIEVKAGRLINKGDGSLTSISERALSFSEIENNKDIDFWINYQQIYFGMSDITILILVCKDSINYLAYKSKDLEENYYMKDFQHRGNSGEGQLWIDQINFEVFKKDIIRNEKKLLEIISNI
jgi:hypothetical protein